MGEIVRCTYKRSILSIQNVWFAHADDIETIKQEAGQKKIDVLNIHGVSFDDVPKGWEEQYTIFSDLSDSIDILQPKIRKNFRYEIRRAKKEGTVIKSYNSIASMDERKLLDLFEETYNQMYRDKGINQTFNRAQVEEYLNNGCMIITIGFFENIPYVFHSYIYNSDTSRFYYSTSPFRCDKADAALIGRINKAVHWYDMQMFKSMGVVNYDWGGISDKNASNGIDQFKLGFGGEIGHYYNINIGLSLKGKAAVEVRNVKVGKH